MNRILCLALALLLMAGCAQPAAGSSSQPPAAAAPSSALSAASQPASVASGSQSAAAEPTDIQTIAEEILTGKRQASDVPNLVIAGRHTTENLALLDGFVSAAGAAQAASVFGYMPESLVPFVFVLAADADTLTLTTYTLASESATVTATQHDVTGIYHGDAFYQFTDGKELFFSLSRMAALPEVVPIEGYQPENDLAGAALSAIDAKTAAQQTKDWLSYYLGYLRDNKLGNPVNELGVVVPKGIVQVEHANASTKVEGAAKILGKDYYQVSCYQDGSLVDKYYVDAANPDNLFLVSMVDGSLIPITCAKMKLNLFPQKKPVKTP